MQMRNHRIRPWDPSDTCTRVWFWELGRPDPMLVKEDVNCGIADLDGSQAQLACRLSGALAFGSLLAL